MKMKLVKMLRCEVIEFMPLSIDDHVRSIVEDTEVKLLLEMLVDSNDDNQNHREKDD